MMNLPIDRNTGHTLPAREQPGYYPGFSTLAQKDFWDEATRKKVLTRVYEVPPIRFFTAEENELMEVIVAHVLPQDDRLPERRIAIVPSIDERLHKGRTPGYRFAKMPPDGDAYRLGFQAIAQMSQHCHDKPFLELSWKDQDLLLKSIHDAKPMEGAAEIWETMEINRWWALVVQDCVEAYYAHPWAWDEIGFAGPAYPRGYKNMGVDALEPFEVRDVHASADPTRGKTATP